MLKKSYTLRKKPLNIGGILCLAVTVYFIYYLLIRDKFLPSCISSVLSWSGAHHWDALAVGLVPIYLALIIFGAAVLSLFIGSALQRWVTQHWLE